MNGIFKSLVCALIVLLSITSNAGEILFKIKIEKNTSRSKKIINPFVTTDDWNDDAITELELLDSGNVVIVRQAIGRLDVFNASGNYLNSYILPSVYREFQPDWIIFSNGQQLLMIEKGMEDTCYLWDSITHKFYSQDCRFPPMLTTARIEGRNIIDNEIVSYSFNTGSEWFFKKGSSKRNGNNYEITISNGKEEKKLKILLKTKARVNPIFTTGLYSVVGVSYADASAIPHKDVYGVPESKGYRKEIYLFNKNGDILLNKVLPFDNGFVRVNKNFEVIQLYCDQENYIIEKIFGGFSEK